MPHSSEPDASRRPRVSRRTLLTALAATGVGGAAIAVMPQISSASTTRSDSTKDDPDLGPNVLIFTPDMSADDIQSKVDSVFKKQEKAQFDDARYAFLFKPGDYKVNINVGFFTQVAGLGATPGDVNIAGSVHVDARWMDGNNATQNFWRSAEGLTVTPDSGTDRWAVSQAAPYRRMHVKGSLALDDGGGWSSGGWISDTVVDGTVKSGSQQQFITRNSELGGWDGSNWNMVFVGVKGAPADSFPKPPMTTVETAPLTREKPFLYVDEKGAFQVFVPTVAKDSSGASWSGGTPKGDSIPLSDFHVAKTSESAADLNAALKDGKHLLMPPGIYKLSDALSITKENTVVLGLGLATLVATNGNAALDIADVDGVKVAGFLIDAGAKNSKTLIQVGPDGAKGDHSANPTSLHDVFVRIGGGGAALAETSLVINSPNTITDHTWLWRADHGSGAGWDSNAADQGLVVNGSDVIAYGLFAEHFKKYQVTWNGENGRTYFFQNEMPYDPPSQSAWKNGDSNGWAAYKVGDSVKKHEAWGVGSYCNFTADKTVVADHAFEAPSADGVKFHHLTTVSLGGAGTIEHIINETGDKADKDNNVQTVTAYPA